MSPGLERQLWSAAGSVTGWLIASERQMKDGEKMLTTVATGILAYWLYEKSTPSTSAPKK